VHAQSLHGGDGERPDIQRRALRVGNPVLFNLHDRLDGIHKILHRDGGDAQAFMGVLHPAGVAVGPEQLNLIVAGPIGLHSLEALLSVVKHHGGGIQGDGLIRYDAGIVPALALVIVHDEHMIGEHLAKPQLALIGRLCLGGGGFGDLDLQHFDSLLTFWF